MITLDSCDVTALEKLEKAQNLVDGIISVDDQQSIEIKKAIAREGS